MASVATKISVLPQLTCPNCWKQFGPEQILWLSTSPELLGDSHLGDEYPKRFLPTRFSVHGNAIDESGAECQELACPHCHLPIPRSCLSLASFYVSIAGSPACGKSYFLASMTWQLRQVAAKYFGCAFGDADPGFNKTLQQYEEDQFFTKDENELVKLAKTEEYGSMYQSVEINGQAYTFPKPFLFTLRPGPSHPKAIQAKQKSRVICLYDNAGESYLSGKDTSTNQVTRHLAVAHSYFYCFDPTQDPRLRKRLRGRTNDLQVTEATVTTRQETLLYELIARVRKHTNLDETERTKRPLFVICTKYDAWWPLLGEKVLELPIKKSSKRKDFSVLDLDRVFEISSIVKNILGEVSPELVGAAESFSENVYYIPVSATGSAPERDEQGITVGIRPKNIQPMWCEVPLLCALAVWSGGLIPYTRSEMA